MTAAAFLLNAGFNCDIYDGTNFRVTDTIAMAFWKLRKAKKEKKEKSDVQEDRD